MVSFTTLIAVSLMAAAQLASASVVPIVEARAVGAQPVPSSPPCNETWALTTKNTIKLDHLVVDDSAQLTKFIRTDQPNQSPTVVQMEKSPANINKITTIQTTGIFLNQYNVMIDFVKQDKSIESRVFKLDEGKKCRVKFSGRYSDIKAVTYVARVWDDESN